MSECTHNCETCGSNCSKKTDFIEKPYKGTNVKKIIGIVSGKGGVGKSVVTSLLASSMNKKGYKVGILDGDITGPSIPKIFGVKDRCMSNGEVLIPAKSRDGIDIVSMNLLLEDETDPVVWRGPVIAGAIKQFWTDVLWECEDYLFIDMPPGTGDVPLTVFQSIPIDGIIIVTSPQQLVGMVVSKAVNMANMMKIKVFGLIENYSYFKCPDNDKEYKIFGESHIDETANKFGLKLLAKLPIDPALAKACDNGLIEDYDMSLELNI
ncbi:MAG: Mrp/NBP35 family ATP-binding protein [Abditibacteriota bacterium]|nr:Mrp/NBP35 family ATP-binding protein [Abditibacteriota bacterium]